VIGYDKLKRNFKQFKDKRALLKDYDAFLADLRVYKMLPEVLGREFYKSKKFPAPLKLHGFSTDAELHDQLNSAASSTVFMLGNGPNYSVRIGKTQQKAQDVAENAERALLHALTMTTVHDDISLG
jgi:ribosome biogenesis protein UTP30